ncbi:hypothetical protein ACNR9Q_01910 [Maribacter sp. X9]|uniref:hypothetical protein n=1 Tax=Maribacter sp. X9 TaxID=3402159 RepID=UPI003AF39D96
MVVIATIVPYFINGQSLIWWESVVLAPLKYTEARRYSTLKMAPLFVLIGLFLFYSHKSKRFDFNDKSVQILLIAICGLLVSFIKGGRINGHYLIQLHPMLLVLLALVINSLLKQYKIKVPVYTAYILLLILAESFLEYVNVLRNNERNTFFNGEGFSVPKYIENNKLETENILFFECHIGYWNLEKLPPTIAATHPSNICRDELFAFYANPRKNSLEELKYIMEELQPKTVVVRNGKRIMDKKEIEENEYMDAYSTEHYRMLATIENAGIIQRLK